MRCVIAAVLLDALGAEVYRAEVSAVTQIIWWRGVSYRRAECVDSREGVSATPGGEHRRGVLFVEVAAHEIATLESRRGGA